MHTTATDTTRSIERPYGKPALEKDNRRIQRISLPLPVRVDVKLDHNIDWSGITRLADVSAFGAGFTLKRPVKRGRLLLLTIPMPRQLRAYDYSEPQYRIWAIVRRCIETGKRAQNPDYAVGVGFTGKNAPAGYLEKPSMLYDITHRADDGAGFWQLTPADLHADDSDLPSDLRKQTRLHIPEQLVIEKIDATGTVLASEITVTENISVGGAAVFTTFDAEKGSFLRVTSERFGVTILSIVRGSRAGDDGITRLHLEFIDRYFPLEGIVA